MKNKIFAMSDVHGSYDELMALYKKLPIEPEKDILVICGDVVDRGPKTKQVLDQLMEWKKKYPHWQFLFGNHEDLMLDALVRKGKVYGSYDLWWNQGGRETFQSFLPPELTQYEKSISQVKDHITEEYLEFIMMKMPLFYETEDYIFVHAGLQPGLTWEEHKKLLQGEVGGAEAILQKMIWVRDEFLDSNIDWGKKVIHGHTPARNLEPDVQEHRIGIDTAVCYSANNKLTCIELPTEKFYFQEHIK